jgi:hypothetical protein
MHAMACGADVTVIARLCSFLLESGDDVPIWGGEVLGGDGWVAVAAWQWLGGSGSIAVAVD